VGGKRLARDLDALFDADYYRESNPDVAASHWPPRLHYFLFGGPEGRNPHPSFNAGYYLSRYPDVRKSRINPLFHYVLFGAAEGRSAYPSFDAGARGGQFPGAGSFPRPSAPAGPAQTDTAWDDSGASVPGSIIVRNQAWRPLVSVVIPFYNRTTYLAETLASLERQTTRDFEAILINDGSDDPEALRFRDGLRDTGWIRRVDCEHRGQAAARNTGAMLARAEYLMFLDADDLLEASAIEKLCWTLSARPELSFVYSGVTHFGDIAAVCFDEFDAARLYRENYLTVTCVIRRAAFLAAGGFDESLTGTHEDYDFWLRLVEQGHKGELFREALFLYRRHSGGASAARIAQSPQGAEALAQSVVARHRGGAARPPALRDAWRPEPEALLEEVAPAVGEAEQVSLRGDSYRPPSLPNLFCPRVWTSGRIHILYLIPGCVAGGAEVFDLRIFSCLPRDRFRITVLACERPDGAWYEEFRAAADELYSLDRMARDRETRTAFLRYLMVSKRIDIVFNRNTFLGYELAAHWPAVSAETRFVDLLHLHADGEDWVRTSAPYHDKLDLRFAISEDLRKYATGKYGLSPGRFRVLKYGMSAEQMPDLNVSLDRRRAIRKKWGIPDSACVVGFIGRLTEQKDPRRWISVAARIAAALPATVFLVVGDGEMLSESVAAARKRIRAQTIFAGYQSDAAQYCAAMDVLLMTSKYEGIPLVILEALACGTPVVSTDAGGVRECLDAKTGVALPGDAPDDAYAKAVMEAMKRDRATVWAEARPLLLSQFNKDRMENRLQQELSLLAAGPDRDARRRDYQRDLMARPILA
jgi:glycosyltransferase involved in cell wall biosynthesis